MIMQIKKYYGRNNKKQFKRVVAHDKGGEWHKIRLTHVIYMLS